MHRSYCAVSRLAYMTLLLSLVAAPGWGGANLTIDRDDRAHKQPHESIEGPAEGIRGYGKGEVRNDLPSALKGAPAEPTAADLDDSRTDLLVHTKIPGTPMAGSVSAFTISPNGALAVFIADKDTLGRFELYSVPVNGSAAPTRISSGIPLGAGDTGVSAFEISPDSTRVVFLADARLGGKVDDIYSVPIDGSTAPVQLNAAGAAPVVGLGITADSATAIFLGKDTSFNSGRVELYRAPIATALQAVQLSDAGLGNPQGNVVSAESSPNSSRIIYAADGSVDGVFQWYSVLVSATGPGTDVQISAAISSVGLMRIIPDSSRVVYTSDDNISGKREVFSKPIAGGTRVQLNPTMAGTGARRIDISPDGAWVGYLADQNTAGVVEVYRAAISSSGSGMRLSMPMTGSQFADTLNISPDSSTILYEADQTTPGTHELFGAPIGGGAGPFLLHGLTAPADVGFFGEVGTPIIGSRAVYPVFGSRIDLFSVPYNGSASFTQINTPPGTGDALFNVYIPGPKSRLMAYGLGPQAGTVTDEIRVAAVRGNLATTQINVTAAAGARGVLGYELTSDERYGIYLQDRDTIGKPELYSREFDSDGDGAGNAVDNCPFVANPAQDSVIFPLTVQAVNTTTFTWNQPFDVRFVRGPLTAVSALTIDASGTLFDVPNFTDDAIPPAGGGFFYLFATDCPGRSYQTDPGAEPNRDLAGLP